MERYYILNEKHEAIPADLMTWAAWYDANSRRVAADTFGDVRVSTVFLGLDHQYGDGPPLLFETMAFGGPIDEEMERCTTWDEAVAQHAAMCERVRTAGGTE